MPAGREPALADYLSADVTWQTTHETWLTFRRDILVGAQAYLGTTVTGFPHLFLLTGPTSALAHNSVVVGIETQVHYVLDALRVMASHELAAVEVQPQVQQAFGRAVRARMSGTVWVTGGCRSWFLDHAGRNSTAWPWFTGRLRRLPAASTSRTTTSARCRRPATWMLVAADTPAAATTSIHVCVTRGARFGSSRQPPGRGPVWERRGQPPRRPRPP